MTFILHLHLHFTVNFRCYKCQILQVQTKWFSIHSPVRQELVDGRLDFLPLAAPMKMAAFKNRYLYLGSKVCYFPVYYCLLRQRRQKLFWLKCNFVWILAAALQCLGLARGGGKVASRGLNEPSRSFTVPASTIKTLLSHYDKRSKTVSRPEKRQLS